MTHLCGQIRDAVRAGVLRPGVGLPSTRTLAADLGLSRGVVVAVYDQLQAEGYLVARRGSGTVVATTHAAVVNTDDTSKPASPGPIPASPGLPDTGLFPRQDWLKAYATALRQLPDGDLHYGDAQGFWPLRVELADYLGRVRGLRTSPDRILIVNGFAQGLAILGRILPTINIDAVAVEEPGSTGTRNQLHDWGLETPPADVDDNGLRIDSLEQTSAQAVLVTPAHQYPTGVVLAPERRRELIRWVHKKPGRLIIEDDYDAEFRYDHAPVGSLQPLAPDHVITGSSVSKTLAPALRLGWLVLPASLID
ncbi:MAG: PLP-dependent aminotransferase family protein, partial [Actinobacteria bacterium]|nr:PLP-dependent aminotransferase family protein [Actinomycetota bacterium]